LAQQKAKSKVKVTQYTLVPASVTMYRGRQCNAQPLYSAAMKFHNYQYKYKVKPAGHEGQRQTD